jgi:hypothetical protein
MVLNPASNPNDPNYILYGVLSHRIFYPSIQTGQTVTNFKTGIKTRSTNEAFDFYSGQTTKSITNDGYGNSYLNESVPAYRFYDEMKPSGLGGKNMLTQNAASYVYKLNSTQTSKAGLLSASMVAWSDDINALAPNSSQTSLQSGKWRIGGSYTFVGDDQNPLQADGTYPMSAFSPWTQAGTIPAGWRLDSETTLYDVSSHALEEKDMNGQYRAVKYNLNQSRILASANFAQFNDFAYSGAEEEPYTVTTNKFFSGGVQCVGIWSADRGHTGLYSVKANANAEALSFQTISKVDTYVISFWSSSESAEARVSLNGVVQSIATKTLGQAGTWYLMEAVVPITVAGQSLKLGCLSKSADTYFDDFRIHPKGSEVISFVYNKWGELSHILDRSNLYTKYGYDDMGRVVDVYHERLSFGVVKTGHTVYHYANH